MALALLAESPGITESQRWAHQLWTQNPSPLAIFWHLLVHLGITQLICISNTEGHLWALESFTPVSPGYMGPGGTAGSSWWRTVSPQWTVVHFYVLTVKFCISRLRPKSHGKHKSVWLINPLVRGKNTHRERQARGWLISGTRVKGLGKENKWILWEEHGCIGKIMRSCWSSRNGRSNLWFDANFCQRTCQLGRG